MHRTGSKKKHRNLDRYRNRMLLFSCRASFPDKWLFRLRRKMAYFFRPGGFIFDPDPDSDFDFDFDFNGLIL